MPAQNDDGDAAMDEEIATNSIPISIFKSNNIQKREQFIQPIGMMSPGGIIALEAPLSPGAGFCLRDNQFKQANKAAVAAGGGGIMDQLSPRSDGGSFYAHCVCGLPMRQDQETCDQCEGKNSIHIEGKIIKKQMKGG